VRWVDKLLIRFIKAVCEYRQGDPASLQLPANVAHLPGLIFHLRRSPVMRTTGWSPDETAFFRLLASSLVTVSTLVLVQPTLVGYEVGRPSAALPLDSSAMHPQRTLLLDTFMQVLLCHGSSIATWLRSRDDDSTVEVRRMVQACQDDMKKLQQDRFPAPEEFECEQYSSKARYLTQKLSPDVPLSTFLQGLYKAAVGK